MILLLRFLSNNEMGKTTEEGVVLLALDTYIHQNFKNRVQTARINVLMYDVDVRFEFL